MRGVSLLVAALCATLADSAMGFLQSPCSGMRPLTATTSRRGSYIARAHSPRRSLVAPGCEIRSGGARPDFGGRPFPVFPVGGKFPSGKRSDALAPYAGRSPEGKIVPVIAVPGGGIYFWWQVRLPPRNTSRENASPSSALSASLCVGQASHELFPLAVCSTTKTRPEQSRVFRGTTSCRMLSSWGLLLVL
jgi:hypothetical protein